MKDEVYLGLGSNIGDRAGNIISALSLLQSSGYVEIKKISSFYETSPVGYKQRDFYNIAARAQTRLSPCDLLAFIKQAELLLGRKASGHWKRRLIDIDILFYGNLSIENRQLSLTIPHKEICRRLFVLIPLNEIAPNFAHPILNRKINVILQNNSLTLINQKVKIIKI
ncbi:MAG: 2-amino-4-hydroxy-6-hydroxymethyldihydropteridine diphosphokinase [Endomicrobium sp.]|jgi:2-amino-4-hydroxy-6-hydroxymethyldihydropteridine diphosphokinase|nr:2-amino-4-hydroxy-6-hydroxymethyldihydropteridine diphosphokinase [Endomicrobium sp.]